MTCKHLVLLILSMVLLSIAVIGCGSIPAEPTPTMEEPSPTPISPTLTPEDPSIAWSDDFEDGDVNGWRGDSNTHFFVEEGVLNNGEFSGGFTYHESEVSSGTWSFDLFFPEEAENYVPFHEYGMTCDKKFTCFGINSRIEGSKNTSVSIIILEGGEKKYTHSIKLGERLVGWKHFDITRDESGNSKLFINGELILQYKDEINVTPQLFVINTNVIGPVFDNLVVRNQVIDIQSTE